MNTTDIFVLANIMKGADLTSLEFSDQNSTVKLERRPAALPAAGEAPVSPPDGSASAPAPETLPDSWEKGTLVRSPMVGVFYTSPSPESEPFVKVGDTVRRGETLCVIEAMKLMNEIPAEVDGTVAEVCASNGQVVEFDQPLFRLI